MSAPLSPIFYLFLGPSGVLYQKMQHLLAEDGTTGGSHPRVVTLILFALTGYDRREARLTSKLPGVSIHAGCR
jgi:hypothetical protein